MSRRDRVREQILEGRNIANIRFDELIALLEHEGFTIRNATRGSHRKVAHPRINDMIVPVQPDGNGMAKKYQIRLLRAMMLRVKEEMIHE